ncbi:hypothetical protein [Candidatus Nitrospira bockiana]
MKRHLEPVDLMVAIGVFATILGGYGLFIAVNGTVEPVQAEATVAEATTVGPDAAMEWVQPALGQALVDNYLLDRDSNADLHAAAWDLTRAMMAGRYAEEALPGIVGQTAIQAVEQMDADHAARVQFVLGQSIARFTSHGVRSGLVSADQMDGAYNRRMIDVTAARGDAMTAEYREMRDPIVGMAVVSTATAADRFTSETQRRLGEAIVRVASVQDGYLERKGEAQRQLALVTVAALHGEQVAERFEMLARAEAGPDHAIFSEPRTWPEIPFGLMAAGSIGLIGIFFAGLLIPAMRPEIETAEVAPEFTYRKTA